MKSKLVIPHSSQLVIAILVAVIFLLMGFNWIKGVYYTWINKAQMQQVHKQLEEAKLQIATAQAERDRLDVEEQARVLKKKEEQDAREKLESQKREALRLQQEEARRKYLEERSQKEAQRIEKQRQNQVELEEQQRQHQLEREENQAQEKEQSLLTAQQNEILHKSQQQDLASYAANLFSSIPLPPKVTLSPDLLKLNSTIEIRAKSPDTYQSLLQNLQKHDYLGLFNTINNEHYAEYPNKTAIDGIYFHLCHQKYNILLKTAFIDRTIDVTLRKNGPSVDLGPVQWKENRHLYFITFPIDPYSDFFDLNGGWQRHPDGIGYFHEWYIARGPCVIFTGTYATDVKLKSLEELYREQRSALSKKKELGELNEALLKQKLLELKQSSYETILRLIASPSNINTGFIATPQRPLQNPTSTIPKVTPLPASQHGLQPSSGLQTSGGF